MNSQEKSRIINWLPSPLISILLHELMLLLKAAEQTLFLSSLFWFFILQLSVHCRLSHQPQLTSAVRLQTTDRQSYLSDVGLN